jgi:hypothetical protein
MRTVRAVSRWALVGLGLLSFALVPACSADDAAAPAACTKAADCASNVCGKDGKCAASKNGNVGAPAPTDQEKNGTETDVDCGGPTAPKCADGKACQALTDCQNAICDKNVCASVACSDTLKNGTETDVDCGGASCPKCADLKACAAATDCTSGVCTNSQCQVPSPTDGVKNGTESDVDCGGAATNPRCAVDKVCADHSDCESDGCSYQKKCVEHRSCTGHEGGDTCGSGGEGGVGDAQWESCCVTAPAGTGGVAMNKYQVTSGRMRAFLERVNGNVRKFIQDARTANELHGARMDASWDLFLPTAMDGCDQTGTCGADEISDYQADDPSMTPYQGIYTGAYRHLGATVFHGENQSQQGCSVGSPGTHSYWMPANVGSQYFGEPPSEYPQTVYDTKSLNCVNYLMAQSFCIWDGGRLETFAEYTAAGGAPNANGANPGPVPWGSPVPHGVGSDAFYGDRFPEASDATLAGLPAGQTIEWANFAYSYEYPHLVSVDYIVFINAPGRLKYRSPNGHADLVGNLMEMTSDVNGGAGDPRSTNAYWTANGSWEGHGWGYYSYNFTLVNKYGKQGLRCVYPN